MILFKIHAVGLMIIFTTGLIYVIVSSIRFVLNFLRRNKVEVLTNGNTNLVGDNIYNTEQEKSSCK